MSRKLRHNPDLDVFVPDGTKKHELPLWRHYAAILDDEGSFSEKYAESLLNAVRAYQHVNDIRDRVASLPSMFIETEYHGSIISKPVAELAWLKEAEKMAQTALASFGLTPISAGAIERKRKRLGKDEWSDI